MYLANLTRFGEFYDATLGVLRIADRQFFTIEDKWLKNYALISCIPAGDYTCTPHGWNNEPVKFKKVWELQDVPGRSSILVHAGNTIKDTSGCILIGTGLNVSKGKATLLNSQDAIAALRELVGNASFRLTIE